MSRALLAFPTIRGGKHIFVDSESVRGSSRWGKVDTCVCIWEASVPSSTGGKGTDVCEYGKRPFSPSFWSTRCICKALEASPAVRGGYICVYFVRKAFMKTSEGKSVSVDIKSFDVPSWRMKTQEYVCKFCCVGERGRMCV